MTILFLCVHADHHYEDDATRFDFLPCDDIENADYWQAEPAGDVTINLALISTLYDAGTCYNFSITHEAGDWVLSVRNERDEQLDVVFIRGSDRLMMRIDNPTAWPGFLVGDVGDSWKMVIVAA